VLDEDAEQKLLVAAKACNWTPGTFELFRDIIILARDTGMRNQRELYRIRMENLDWNNRIIFVPDSKTADGRRIIPNERPRVRSAAHAHRWKKRRMAVSIQAIERRSFDGYWKTVSRSACEGRSS
jgi:integrase